MKRVKIMMIIGVFIFIIGLLIQSGCSKKSTAPTTPSGLPFGNYDASAWGLTPNLVYNQDNSISLGVVSSARSDCGNTNIRSCWDYKYDFGYAQIIRVFDLRGYKSVTASWSFGTNPSRGYNPKLQVSTDGYSWLTISGNSLNGFISSASVKIRFLLECIVEAGYCGYDGYCYGNGYPGRNRSVVWLSDVKIVGER